MKKKTYKALKNRYYNEIKKRIMATNERNQYKDKAEYYQKRFRAFGKNVKTADPESGESVKLLKWEIKPELYGDYACFSYDGFQSGEETERMIKERFTKELAKQLLESDLVQYIVRGQDLHDPLNQFGTCGGKLYVVPWEQMPNRRTLELEQYVEETLEEGERK